MKRGETPVRKLEKVFVNNTENELDMFEREMVKISWGGYRSLEVNNRANYKTNFYVDDA